MANLAVIMITAAVTIAAMTTALVKAVIHSGVLAVQEIAALIVTGNREDPNERKKVEPI